MSLTEKKPAPGGLSMPMSAEDLGSHLHAIRLMIRERYTGGKLYGRSQIDKLIDMVVAPLVLDAFLGPPGGCSCIKDAAHAAGEDIEILLNPIKEG